MIPDRAVVLALLFVGALFFLAGCGCEPSRTAFDPNGKFKMEEIGQMLVAVKAQGDRPPVRAEDLDRIESLVPLSIAELRSGDIAFQWGATLSDAGNAANAVLAYEKKAASDGAWVLMQDGTVKQMTPSELSSAPKAK